MHHFKLSRSILVLLFNHHRHPFQAKNFQLSKISIKVRLHNDTFHSASNIRYLNEGSRKKNDGVPVAIICPKRETGFDALNCNATSTAYQSTCSLDPL